MDGQGQDKDFLKQIYLVTLVSSGYRRTYKITAFEFTKQAQNFHSKKLWSVDIG